MCLLCAGAPSWRPEPSSVLCIMRCRRRHATPCLVHGQARSIVHRVKPTPGGAANAGAGLRALESQVEKHQRPAARHAPRPRSSRVSEHAQGQRAWRTSSTQLPYTCNFSYLPLTARFGAGGRHGVSTGAKTGSGEHFGSKNLAFSSEEGGVFLYGPLPYV